MTNEKPLTACRAARVPLGGLRALAPLRSKMGVRVVLGDDAWVEWEGDRPDVIAALLAVPEVEMFERCENRWHLRGHHLPAMRIDIVGEAVSLQRSIVPAAFELIAPDPREPKRVPMALVRCEVARPTTALFCSIESLQTWADAATTLDIAAVRGARFASIAWLQGAKLPVIENAVRFWGEQVWRPLGWRTEPEWSEAALREAANVGTGEVLVIRNDRTEAIPSDAFRPLTRAAIRLANA